MRLYGVEMLPTSLVACFVNEKEVRLLELANEGFSFRIPDRLESIQSLYLNYLVFQESRYETVKIVDFTILEEVKEPFYYVYTIGCVQADYKKYTSYIIKDYTVYVKLKLSGDDAYCSQEKVNYPAELDTQFEPVFSKQKEEWLSSTGYPCITPEIMNRFELAITLDSHRSYERYLSMEMKDFVAMYWKENYLIHHPLAKKEVPRIYVGNEFCHNLFPTMEQLLGILEKAKRENVKVTLVFTYMMEHSVEPTEELFKKVYEWCQNNETIVEVVVNDWGMLNILKDKNAYFRLSFGVLLNKRRKDPRYPYKSGFQKQIVQLSENSLNGALYRNFLEKYNITRYEYEACGYRMEIPTPKNSLHFPFYQTNTSSFCTLYAKCKTGERGKQQMVEQCQHLCEELAFVYPKHLRMVGRYNSLFGFDDTLLCNFSELEYYVTHGIDRLVLNLL